MLNGLVALRSGFQHNYGRWPNQIKNITLAAYGEEDGTGSKNKSRRHLGSCLSPGPSDGSLDKSRTGSHLLASQAASPRPLHFASKTFP